MKNHFLLRLYKSNGDLKFEVKVDTLEEAEQIWKDEKVKPTIYYVETITTQLKGY